MKHSIELATGEPINVAGFPYKTYYYNTASRPEHHIFYFNESDVTKDEIDAYREKYRTTIEGDICYVVVSSGQVYMTAHEKLINQNPIRNSDAVSMLDKEW